ncbi:MAG: hypothetical protein MJ078_07040, partial [Clostridia bacterium]|nr:hypothetical protein [Clostridia bacterium]
MQFVSYGCGRKRRRILNGIVQQKATGTTALEEDPVGYFIDEKQRMIKFSGDFCQNKTSRFFETAFFVFRIGELSLAHDAATFRFVARKFQQKKPEKYFIPIVLYKFRKHAIKASAFHRRYKNLRFICRGYFNVQAAGRRKVSLEFFRVPYF